LTAEKTNHIQWSLFLPLIKSGFLLEDLDLPDLSMVRHLIEISPSKREERLFLKNSVVNKHFISIYQLHFDEEQQSRLPRSSL
jgi:hypothetical protein